MNQSKFERLLAVAREREETRRQYRIELDVKYRTTYRDNWTRTERNRYDKLSDSAFAAIGKFTDALGGYRLAIGREGFRSIGFSKT